MINKVALQGPNGMNLQSLTKAEPAGQAENTWNIRIQSGETVEISLGGKSLQRVDGLEKELADIFGASSFDEFEAGPEDGDLEEEEEALFQEIDALVTKNMSASELKNFNHIHREIDRIFSDDRVTEQEEALIEKLDERLEAIFEKQRAALAPEDREKLDGLVEKLETLEDDDEYEEYEAEDLARGEAIMETLEELFSQLMERLESGKGSGSKPGKGEKNLDEAFGDIMGRQQAGGVTRTFLAVFQEQKDLLF